MVNCYTARENKYTATGAKLGNSHINCVRLNNKWVKEDIKREIKKYLETEEDENTNY